MTDALLVIAGIFATGSVTTENHDDIKIMYGVTAAITSIMAMIASYNGY